ncbi:MAG: formate dehydrogenase subunit gamma [Gammaproteobacteria bacterium]|uniref:formate dehydrogenase subunit gamma n=1 Tax=Pseudacidovorax sp. TaxID=1934311 RepID=UPI001B78A833|nr:formate dehydrogenase subunit gamma [Pseudacidovorax sp.]MBP6898190.1 formate dehydrogenase subunit gamma [Pseudacidovorax sp.]
MAQTPTPPSGPARVRSERVLATPDELRDRLRQLGRAPAEAADPRLATVREIVARHALQRGGLLPALHDVQDALGFVPAEVVGEIALGFNLSRAEVHGVISYYHHFRSEPAGRHVLEVCRAEACQAMGAEALWQHACEGLGLPEAGGTRPDGSMTLQPVYCLGLCAQSPAAMLDGRPHARLSPERLDRVIGACMATEVTA